MKPAFGNLHPETFTNKVDTLLQGARGDNYMIEIVHSDMVDYNATG
jgi:hypothetical protein